MNRIVTMMAVVLSLGVSGYSFGMTVGRDVLRNRPLQRPFAATMQPEVRRAAFKRPMFNATFADGKVGFSKVASPKLIAAAPKGSIAIETELSPDLKPTESTRPLKIEAIEEAVLPYDVLKVLAKDYGVNEEIGSTCRFMEERFKFPGAPLMENFWNSNPQWQYYLPKGLRAPIAYENNELYEKAFRFAIFRNNTQGLGCFLAGMNHAPVAKYEDGVKYAIEMDSEKAFEFLVQNGSNSSGSVGDYNEIMGKVVAPASIKDKYAGIWKRYHGGFLKDSAENQHCTIL